MARRLCHENGVKLFVIPCIPTRTKLEGLKALLARQAKKLDVRLSTGFGGKEVDLTDALDGGNQRRIFDKRPPRIA